MSLRDLTYMNSKDSGLFCKMAAPIDGLERLSRKLNMTAHQEFNTSKTRAKFHGKIRRGKDPLGRRGVRFKGVTDFSQLPKVVEGKLEKYASQLLTT